MSKFTMNKLKEFLIIISEAKGIKSKLSTINYPFQILLKEFLKIFKIKYNPKLIFNTIIENKDGTFFCGRERTYLRICASSFEEEMQDYFNIEEGVFIDVGSHCGRYSIAMGNNLGKSGRVISIEPEFKNFKYLKKNVILNSLKNVNVLRSACGSEDGYVKLYINEKNKETTGHCIKDPNKFHTYAQNKMDFSNNKFQNVRVLKLDSIVKKYCLDRVDLIKIDAEGVELDVLSGAEGLIKKFSPNIIIEVDIINNQKMKDFFKRLSYNIKEINGSNFYAFKDSKLSLKQLKKHKQKLNDAKGEQDE